LVTAGIGRRSCVGWLQERNLNYFVRPPEAEYIHATGPNSIYGQAFLRRNDGVVVYAAGSDVTLIPYTPYAEERMRTIYGDRKTAYFKVNFENDDPLYHQYMRKTVANGEGRFSFEGLANGTYYITTHVEWMAGDSRQGGALMERVSVGGGNKAEVILRGS